MYYYWISMDWKYKIIQKLSEICDKILNKGPDTSFNLNNNNYITDMLVWKDVVKTLDIVKTKRKYQSNRFKFYDTDERKIRNIDVYSPYKQFISGVGFKSDLGTYTVKISNNLKNITKTLN